jgi:hypothetical protein
VRTPLQGGLPPTGAVAGTVLEIACDESGFSGTNLLDPATPVITHASVDLAPPEAASLIGQLRSGFRFSPHELKSGQFLRRPQAGEALDWLLEFFLVTRIVDLLLAEPSYAAGTRLSEEHRPAAVALYRAGHAAAGHEWAVFLSAFVELARVKRRHPADRAIERFLHARDALGGLPDGLTRERARALVARDDAVPPPLEPLLPALAETVLFWSDATNAGTSAGPRQVLVVHDEQSALTADRLTRLGRALADRSGRSPLAGLVMVDSRDDPRVQVADLLAGVARREPGVLGRLSTTSLSAGSV